MADDHQHSTTGQIDPTPNSTPTPTQNPNPNGPAARDIHDPDAGLIYRKIDPSSPYYLGSNDHPGISITTIKFDGKNYETWSRALRRSLKARKKFGFVDGSIKKPVNPMFHDDWDAVQNTLVSWILNSIVEKEVITIPSCEEAKPLWDLLKRRHTVSNGQRKQQLKQDLAECKQTSSMSVAEYFGQLETLWDELALYDSAPECVCGMGEHFLKKREEDKFHDFLYGINREKHGALRSQLIAMAPLPTLDFAYSKMTQDEQMQLRDIPVKSQSDNVMTFAVQTSTQGTSDSKSRFLPGVTCTFCNRIGHEESTCYGKHGYPEWWGDRPQVRNKPNAGRGNGSRGRGGARPRVAAARAVVCPTSDHTSVAGSDTGGSSAGIPGVTPAQLQQLLSLLGNSTTNDSLSGEFLTHLWLIDTGASNHVTGDLSLLSNVSDMPPCTVGLPDGNKVVSVKCGTVRLSQYLVLRNVYFVPNLCCNLMSVTHLTDDTDCVVHFVQSGCVIQDQQSRMLIGLGERRGGLYYFRGGLEVQANRVVDHQDPVVWHQRLGHPSATIVKALPFDFISSNKLNNKTCEVCCQAKQSRDSFLSSDNNACFPFELIHCDLWGPYHTVSSCGARYFLTIVDDYTRGVWIYLMRDKTEVFQLFTRFLALVHRQFNAKVKTVRSDNGTEFFCLKNLFDESGIIFQTSCVNTPQQNGRVERKHRHILDVARALKFQANLPVKFWGECILTAGYLINRTPSKLLKYKSPYECLFGVKAHLTELRVFGSLCYAYNLRAKLDKFASRSRKCIFVGYPFGKKGWKLYDLQTHEFFVSRDVRFVESVFPFSAESSAASVDKSVVSQPVIDSLQDDFEDEAGILEMPPTSAPPNTTSAQSGAPLPVAESAQQQPASEAVSSSPAAVVVEARSEVSSDAPLGRGMRTRVPSVRLRDFVVNTVVSSPSTPPPVASSSRHSSLYGTPYSLSHYLDSSCFSEKHRTFLAAVSTGVEPTSFREAMRDAGWRDAMHTEIRALEKNGTWTLEDLPVGKKALGSRWIYKIKYRSDGQIERLKARLVVFGNHQQEGIDYSDTFAPVAKMVTVRTFLAVAAAKDWELHQMDVHNAFLHGDLTEEVYMRIPPGFDKGKDGKVCRLRKSLYGLKQAPRCWFAKLTAALRRYGFIQSYSDYSLFTFSRQGIRMNVLVYVDDLIISGSCRVALAEFKKYLSSCFHMKDLGKLKYFLGVEVARNAEGIFLCQRKYTLDIISEAGLLGAKPVSFPMEQNQKLGASTSPDLADGEKYRRLVGRLIYLAFTRPDLCFSVHILSQFLQAPKEDHWFAALRVVRYLKGSPGQGVLLRRDCNMQLQGWCDSDWAACPQTRRSVTGWMVFLGDSPISWKTKKQATVSLSSAEAEYRAMAKVTCELKWLKGLLKSLGVDSTGPMQVFCDSQSALHLAQNPVFHERSKHIEVDCHFLRDAVLDGTIATSHVSTSSQLADIFTKPLGRQQFEFLLAKLGIHNLHAPT